MADDAGVEGAGAGEDGAALFLPFALLRLFSCGSRSGDSASSTTEDKLDVAGFCHNCQDAYWENCMMPSRSSP